jgi:hypothetical protein
LTLPPLANSRLERLLRFSSTPVAGRIKLFDRDVRADKDWAANDGRPSPYAVGSDESGGMPTKGFPYVPSVYATVVLI